MNIRSLKVQVDDGSIYDVPMGFGSDAIQAVVKDALLRHLLVNGNSNKVVLINDHLTEQPKPKPSPSPMKNWQNNATTTDERSAFDGCALVDLLGAPQVKYHGKKPLLSGSTRKVLNVELVRFFFESNNEWIPRSKLCWLLAQNKRIGLTEGTISTYLYDNVKSGMLQDIADAQNNTKSMRLNPVFINQFK